MTYEYLASAELQLVLVIRQTILFAFACQTFDYAIYMNFQLVFDVQICVITDYVASMGNLVIRRTTLNQLFSLDSKHLNLP